jgi:hypothetical protein
MSINQLTKCVPPGGEGNVYVQAIAGGLVGGSIWAMISYLLGVSVGALLVGAGFALAYAAIVGVCDWFFNTRLICVADSDVLIGRFWGHEEAWDGDFCLNVLPAPFISEEPGSTLTEMQDSAAIQHRFVVLPDQNPDLSGYPFCPGYPDHVYIPNKNHTPLVHNEIEGTKMQAWCSAMIATLATLAVVGTASDVFCDVFGPFAWLCKLIVLAVGALIAYVVNEIAHAVGDMGSVADVAVDPDAKTIVDREKEHPAIALEGRLIYDAGHEGWLELHAVRKIMSIPESDHDNLDDTRAGEIIKKIREAGYVSESGAWSGRLVATHSRLG